ncbi:MAG: hydrolase [Cyanobacteria bacterium RUI128]|nr:hydrolase [Cyanobacteria bacterium RUI128]
MGNLLRAEDTVLFVIDVQDKLVGMLKNSDEISKNNVVLVKTAKTLGVPLVVTEQYPKGLGQTIPDIAEHIDADSVFEKTSFSALEDDNIKSYLTGLGRKNIVLTGIETHICVYQTALVLLDAGYNVYVVKNATSSRKSKDYKTALELMRDFGVRLTCVETILFELLRSSKHPNFKEIQALIK